ncbi:hypothetical protein FHX42_002284 [Saccharopolyspora lacisalsi]|uniref:Uncharacterized protein n=1 Tax=Halosaccharopolyspora lacisalsi TaxID=1000566 RepID=A0A839DZM3_9PSEU|nr:hypothetical protein [Halosaccharopolyspora lacisalsi]MBA8824937.1 hypothetical protein [Halosaccharopolyspora lacisalsi]
MITFGALLVFVYIAVGQVRPSAAVGTLQHLALRAREAQQSLPAGPLPHALPAARRRPLVAEVTAERVGHVVHIDGQRTLRDLNRVAGRVEIELRVGTAEHVVPSGLLAEVRGDDSLERGLLVDAVLDALTGIIATSGQSGECARYRRVMMKDSIVVAEVDTGARVRDRCPIDHHRSAGTAGRGPGGDARKRLVGLGTRAWPRCLSVDHRGHPEGIRRRLSS